MTVARKRACAWLTAVCCSTSSSLYNEPSSSSWSYSAHTHIRSYIQWLCCCWCLRVPPMIIDWIFWEVFCQEGSCAVCVWVYLCRSLRVRVWRCYKEELPGSFQPQCQQGDVRRLTGGRAWADSIDVFPTPFELSVGTVMSCEHAPALYMLYCTVC